MNYKIVALLIICVCAIATAGCIGFPSGSLLKPTSSQDVSPSDSSGRLQSESTMGYAGTSVPMPVPTPVPTTNTPTNLGGTGIDTKIIRTAYLTIEVKDVPGSVELLKSLAEQKGGYLSSTNIQKSYNDRLSGMVIIRIPAAGFESTLVGVKAIGTLKSVSTQGQDVTEEYVDLQAQKTSYQNQLAQYNEIMKKSEKVEDIIKVQEQIDRVQTELNRLDGRIRYLNSRIDLSTITVNLHEPEPVGGDTGHSFITAINEGISGFFGMIDAIIIILFTLLPLLILGGVAYGVYRWKKGKKSSAPPVEQPTEKK